MNQQNKTRGIVNTETTKEARKAAERKARNLTTEEYKYCRLKAKHDLFFLSHGILNYKKLSPNLHGHFCRSLEASDHWQFRLSLLPRGHFKTTIETKADAIRLVLPDDSGTSIYPRDLGTNCRLLICHETDKMASRFLIEITNHFLGNPKLIALFPECVPDRRKNRINQNELELPRTENWSEPTIDTMGVGGKSQGRHFNYIKADDLIGDKARDSQAEMDTAKDWIDGLESFLIDRNLDHIDFTGTRYSLDDTYDHIMKMYGKQLYKYIRSAIEKDKSGELKPIFPELFPLKTLLRMKSRPKTWIQYSNDPQGDFTDFSPGWKRFFQWRTYPFSWTITRGLVEETIQLRDCDVCILYDPAPSGNAGLVVTATDKKNRVFILEAHQKAWKPPEAVNVIFQLVQKYKPRLVAIESDFFMILYKHWFESEMRLRNIYFHVEPVKTNKVHKPVRAKGLSNYFAAGQIFFHETQIELIEQYDRFGAVKEYHIIDALAYGPEVWQPGLDRKTYEDYQKAEEQFLDDRDVETGYSYIG